MRLGLRLLITVAVVLSLLVGLFASYDRRRLETLLEEDLRRDALHLARALSTTIGRVQERDGLARGLEILEDVDEHEPAVRIRWVPLSELNLLLPADRRARLEAGEALPLRPKDPGGRPSGISCVSPTLIGGRLAGAIEVSESYQRRDTYLAGSLRAYLKTALAVWITMLAAAVMLGRRWVIEPVLKLEEKMERIGSGDLSSPLELETDDELAELARGLNTMCDALMEEESRRREMAHRLEHAERLLTVAKLAAGLAHELGTPLNVIAGRARRIERQDILDGCRRDARVIHEQADRIAQITRQLLDFARRDTAHRRPVNPLDVAERAVEILEPEASQRQVEVRIEDHDAPGSVQLDPRQIEQVLVNVLLNAIHASTQGQVVHLEVRHLEEEGPEPGVEYRVTDDGVGIAPEDLDKVFDPFFTTKAVGEGTGLGLSVVHGIIEDHGGRILVESEPDRGTSVTVRLPGESS